MNEHEKLLMQMRDSPPVHIARIAHRNTGDDMYMAKAWFETYGVKYQASDLIEYVKIIYDYEDRH